MWYVYVLESQQDKSWYIGCTNDLKKRFHEHNTGKSTYTRTKMPWKLIYYEASFNKKGGFKREIYLKSGYGRRYLKKRLEGSIYNSER